MISRTIKYWRSERDDIVARLIVWGGILIFIVFGLIPWMIGIGKYIKWIFS